ncbi:ShlB/FhaC/HecB family hemolysin secretion/activation protein [Elioraea sp.]|uniref:ShlB/FhaC/HecB family hemolysin secretion/activation protein n=1 Tax=Elioraea sp. TaxID=2185103 RepID=UPI003F6E479F
MRRAAVAALALAVLPALAGAQPIPTPGPASPEFQRREFEPRLVPRAEPPAVETVPTPAAPVAPAGPSFVLREVRLEGARTIPEASLAPLSAGLIGTAVTIETLEALTAAISSRYRAEGYVLSQAILPAQAIENGVVRIVVVEGLIDRVLVEGGPDSGQEALRRRFRFVAEDRPLALGTLERAVLLSRDTLGGGVETVLGPSPSTFGAADLTVRYTQRPYEGFALVDNRASRLFGPWVARAGFTTYDLLGQTERLDLSVASSLGGPELRFIEGAASLPLAVLDGTVLDGVRIEFGADATRGRPDLRKSGTVALTALQEETNLRAGLFVPVIRTRSENLFLRAGLTWRESTTRQRFAGVDLGRATDRLLVAEGRATWDVADRFDGVTLIDGALRQGIATAGTKIGAGASRAREDFTLLRGSIARVQELGPPEWSLFGELVGQLAGTILPNSERFALGGERLGRGFAPGNTTGDHGFGGRVELRRLIALGEVGGLAPLMSAYIFGDWGAAIDRDRNRDGRRWESLASVGIGARIDLATWLTVTPEIAHQLRGRPSDTASGKQETRGYLGAIVRF